jgi:hypothetical protein
MAKALFANTLLGTILDLAEARDFPEMLTLVTPEMAKAFAITDREVVVGNMTDTEKAVFVYHCHHQAKLRSIRLGEMLDGQADADQLTRELNFTGELLYVLIRSRIALENPEIYRSYDGYGIREDYQVVVFEPTKNFDSTKLQTGKASPFNFGFFNEVDRIAANADFSVCDMPVAEGETVIGEMSLLEKAVNTYRDRLADYHNANVDQMRETEISGNQTQHKGVTQVLFHLISRRLVSEGKDEVKRADNFGHREGYKIVLVKSEPDPFDVLIVNLKAFKERLMAKLEAGAEDEEMDAHNPCVDCEDYDTCDSPVKKPR